jgi:hypothetical protein
MLTVIQIIIIAKGVKRFSTANIKVLHWTYLFGSVHLPSSEPIYLKSIITLSFHLLPVFQIKVFQQISSPKFCAHSPNHYINKKISVLKVGCIKLHSHRHVSLTSHINDSDNMNSGINQSRWCASCQVALELFQKLVTTPPFAWRVSELLQWHRSGRSQAVCLERRRTRAMQWDTSKVLMPPIYLHDIWRFSSCLAVNTLLSITKVNCLMLFMEIIEVYCRNRGMNTLRR